MPRAGPMPHTGLLTSLGFVREQLMLSRPEGDFTCHGQVLVVRSRRHGPEVAQVGYVPRSRAGVRQRSAVTSNRDRHGLVTATTSGLEGTRRFAENFAPHTRRSLPALLLS